MPFLNRPTTDGLTFSGFGLTATNLPLEAFRCTPAKWGKIEAPIIERFLDVSVLAAGEC